YFVPGVAFYLFRDSIRLDARAAIVAFVLAVLFLRFGCYHLFFPVLGGYLILMLGVQNLAGAGFFRHRDYSYGTYIYAWPVQLLVLQMLGTPASWWMAAALCMAATLPIAALSWHFIERPSLKLARSSRLGETGVARDDRVQAGGLS